MNFRVLICTLLAFIAVGTVFLLVPTQEFSPKGILLPGEKVFPPISADQVTIYEQAPQAHAIQLGVVRVEVEFHTLNEHTKKILFQKVKEMAATVGSNSVIITMLVPDDGVRHMLTFIGNAVYIPKN